MKSIKTLLVFVLLTATVSAQTVKYPMVGSSEDPSTSITQIETNDQHTVVSFKHTFSSKGGWVQVNKSMYLQDAGGEDRYNYIKSEGIPTRPERLYSTVDNQTLDFKVYFEKIKPGTKFINIIERARSLAELQGSVNFLNYFKVDLNKSQPISSGASSSVQIKMVPPPPSSEADTDYVQTQMASIKAMAISMYDAMYTGQLNMYSKPGVLEQLAKIMKTYYDALIKVGFSQDAALKIITSKQLVSVDGGGKN